MYMHGFSLDQGRKLSLKCSGCNLEVNIEDGSTKSTSQVSYAVTFSAVPYRITVS